MTPDKSDPRAPDPQSPTLTSTYRVQLTAAFGFDAAREAVPYLAQLGISHLYCSPALAARPGSAHGYDVVDPARASPELGGEAAFRALAAALHARGMGLVLDIVPNHMYAGPTNPYWTDVLTRGRESPYASWFDLDWGAGGAARGGKIVLAVLGDHLDAVLARDELRVAARGDGFVVTYFDHVFPLHPRTTRPPFTPDDFAAGAEGRARLRRLLARQRWALAFWRTGLRDVNYRRFFDVNDLLGVRVEDPAVFDATHAKLLEWVADGVVDGLRVDHVDGLRDPLGYLRRLRRELDARRPGGRVPVFVEKILSPGERLRDEWPVDGTTGYEFAAALEPAYVDPRGYAVVEAAYRQLLRIRTRGASFDDVARRAKELTLRRALQPDVRRLVRLLDPVARAAGAPFTRPQLGEAIIQLLAGMPVYRTYVRAERDEVGDRVLTRWDVAEVDRSTVARAAANAVGRGGADADTIAFVARALVGEALPEEASGVARGPRRAPRLDSAEGAREFAPRFQQTSGPATAKGVEDTALYRWFPIASLCEVGGHPTAPPDDAVGALHAANGERQARWPRSLVTVTTHDTKRTADARARLDALSEVPNEWRALVARWRARHAPLRARAGDRLAPDPNAEYLLYQTLVAIWPLPSLRSGQAHDGDGGNRAALAERAAAYMRKARREAKAQTSWTEPNDAYEGVIERFTRALLLDDAGEAFRREVGELVRRLGRAAMWTSLGRVLVQLTSPGTPDVYQGDELWLHALVDPDNRRPVDYAARRRALDDVDTLAADGTLDARAARCAALVGGVDDGRAKLFVTHRVLHARRDDPELFSRGAYVPLVASGERAQHVIAFARVLDGRVAVTIAPRLPLLLCPDAAPPVGPGVWGDTVVAAPAGVPERLIDVFGAHSVCRDARRSGTIAVADALTRFPIAMLLGGPVVAPARR